MQRGTCPFGQKVQNAAGRGRARRDHHEPGRRRQRRAQGPRRRHARPAAGADPGDRHPVRARPASSPTPPARTARVKTETQNDIRRTNNVIAETAGGNPNKIVLVGSHLDSVAEGPGINDNGTGSAFNLELALQMAKLAAPDQQGPLRLVGRRGVRPDRLDQLRHRRPGTPPSRRPEQDHAQPELRHARLAQPREVRLRRRLLRHRRRRPPRRPSTRARRRSSRPSSTTSPASASRPSRPPSTAARTTRPSRTAASRRAACSPAPRCPRPPPRPTKWGGIPGRPFDPNYHQAGDTSTTSTWSPTSRWPTPPPTSRASTPAARSTPPAGRGRDLRRASTATTASPSDET